MNITTVADFTVPGIVKSERKRQRFINGVGHVGKRTDEPDRASFKNKVALFARMAIPAPVDGPVALELHVTRLRPTSYPKRPTARMPWPWADTKKPDCSNFAKVIEDALIGVAYHDDAQIVDLRVTKGWGEHAVRVVVKRVSIEEAAA